jgi:TPP-dependent pyruvate/acetoin dehydrogenase alpha subunit
MQKIVQIEEMLISSLGDLKNALSGKGLRWGETTLTKAFRHLKNENIHVDIQTHGTAYELNGAQTEAVYRLCQEAVTNAIRHGQAKTILSHSLRFHPQEVDNLRDRQRYRLPEYSKKLRAALGMEARIEKIIRQNHFASDG